MSGTTGAPAIRRHRVLVVDPHPVPRRGLVQVLADSLDLELAMELQDPAECLAAIVRCRPDVVVCDIASNGDYPLEVVRSIRREHAELPVLVFSDRDEVPFAPRALRAGANGYVMKTEPAWTVLEAIRAVLRGEIYVAGAATRRMLSEIVRGRRPDTRRQGLGLLSDRELEVFELIGNWHATGAIARRLQVSVKTVNAHRAHIRGKLGLDSGHELVRQAVAWVQDRDHEPPETIAEDRPAGRAVRLADA